MSSGPTPNFNLPILPISLCLSPGKLSEFSLSKHLTCVSRTHSQPQPVEIFPMLISRQVVGVFTCPNTSLVSPGSTPNFSLSRCTQALHKKTCRLRQSIDKSHLSNDLTANMPKNGSETQAHHLNPDYSNSSMPSNLHQQCTNLVSTANP